MKTRRTSDAAIGWYNFCGQWRGHVVVRGTNHHSMLIWAASINIIRCISIGEIATSHWSLQASSASVSIYSSKNYKWQNTFIVPTEAHYYKII